ncbi:hypothetical protein MG293_001979 [Ovis ammon polii]|uniref:C2H2-type domain-containing protein n=1 Tax=Ovis ammon polii TaxID=230172 RepID=A0AAD4URT7_OVIAM|nr:hypothetical protein MG293_001979 [Ovis ammon polii]
MCNPSQVQMEQGAEGLNQWHVASHQFTEGSFVNQPVSQEDPFLPKQPIPAPQRVEQQYSRTQEKAPRRRSPVSRPYRCDYENCEKAYTKRSHLVSHQRKHTGDLPNPRIEPASPVSPVLTNGFLSTNATWEALPQRSAAAAMSLQSSDSV